MTNSPKGVRPLVGVRAAFIMVTSVLAGIGVAALTYWQTSSTPAALLAGGASLGATIKVLHDILGSSL